MVRRYDRGYRQRRKGRWSGNRGRRGPVVMIYFTGSLALMCLLAAAWLNRSSAPPAKPQTRLATTLLSLRRVPETTTAEVAEARLKTSIDAFAKDTLTETTCLVVEVRGHRIIDLNSELPLVPASTEKLLTGVEAIKKLGTDYRFRTQATSVGAVSNGVLTGDLYLIGGGDPVLSTAEYTSSLKIQPAISTKFEDLADAIAATGIRSITGSIIGDESRYDNVRYLKSWGFSFVIKDHTGPLSALDLNDGFTDITGVGAIAAEPATYAADVLKGLLQARNITVAGGASSGVAPIGTKEIAAVESQPLGEIVADMLRNSDNMTAELLTKELDRAAGGKGTTHAGAAATVAGLSAGGLPVGKTKLIDGSGLDSGNKTTCNLLHAALLAGGVHGPIGDGLAVAGRSGTLNDKMTSTAAEGRLRAKTGAIYGVIGLVGYVDAPAQNPTSTPPVSFAFVLNGVPDEIKRGIIRDRLGETLALFPAGFSAATIEPLPPVIPTPPKGTKPTAKTTTTTKPAGPTTTTSASP